MLKAKQKTAAKPLPAADSDSDSHEEDGSSADEEFMSDEEFPMSEDDNGDTTGEAEDQPQEATKWAKAMAKFLRKSTDAKVLSKAVTDRDKERQKEQTKTYKFDVVGADGQVKKEPVGVKLQNEEKPDDLMLARQLLRQKALLKRERQKDILGLRVRPSVHDYERERSLRKVATKGTVQLFNAVRNQQKDVNQKLEEAGKLEYKREKVLKSLNKKEFLNALMNGPRAKSELVDNLIKKEESEDIKSEIDSDEEPKSTWGALRADFLTGKKSGWDKEDGEDDTRTRDDLDDGMGSEDSE